jgi:hypothetical protein
MSRLRELAYISGLRGTDGSGVCQGLATKKKFHFTLEKSKQDITYFIWYNDNHEKGNDKILSDYTCNFIMGHVRSATKGNVTDANAHPFDTGRYISAHNGTLYDKKYQHNEKTDSEMMFEDVEQRGLFNTLRDVDKDSAWAVVSFDKTAKELSFATNGKRPLVYCFLKKRRVFFWASERRQLDFILAGVQEKSEIFRFTDDMLYTFRPDDVEAGHVPKWSLRKISKPVETTFFRAGPTGPSMAIRGPATETKQTHGKNGNIIRIADTGKYPIVDLINAHKVREHERVHRASLLVQSCVYCQRKMDLLAQYEGVQIDDGMFSCADCEDIQAEMKRKVN